MKDAVDQKFEAVSLEIVESIRLGDSLSEFLFERLKEAMAEVVDKYKNCTSMPKYIYYCIQVLRDNLIGKLNSSTGAEHIFVANVNSYIDQAIEDLLLSD